MKERNINIQFNDPTANSALGRFDDLMGRPDRRTRALLRYAEAYEYRKQRKEQQKLMKRGGVK